MSPWKTVPWTNVATPTSGGEAIIASVSILVILGSPVIRITKNPIPLNPIRDPPPVVVPQVDPLDLPEPDEEKIQVFQQLPARFAKLNHTFFVHRRRKTKALLSLLKKRWKERGSPEEIPMMKVEQNFGRVNGSAP